MAMGRFLSLRPGQKLGPYEVLAVLGAGGMGEVYRARDARLERDVAIKVLPGDFSADPARLRRFEQEARAASALNHPNILTVFDLGTHDGAPFLVMELLEGESLRERLGGGPVPARKVLEIAVQVARGLAAAHEKGIVHRDLKPDNLFLTRDGHVKILDFGLAKLQPLGSRGVGIPSGAPTFTQGTDPGVVLGTIGYMAPEQARGQTADHRADLFALGAILYEMLSGERAFKGDSAVEALNAILTHDPPEISVGGRPIAPTLDRIVRHCLEKDREERFQSTRDLTFDLETLERAGSQPSATSAALAASPSRRPSRERLWMAATALLGLLAAGLTLVVVSQPGGFSDRKGQAAAAAQALTPIPLTSYPGDERDPSFSPDGNQIVFSWAPEGGNHDLYVKLIGAGDPIRLTSTPESEAMARWSPDGKWIAVSRFSEGKRQLVVLPALGGPERILARDLSGPIIAWAPDSRGVLYAGGSPDGLYVAPLSGGGSRLIASSTTDWLVSLGIPSPDGKWLFLERRGVSRDKVVVPLEGGLRLSGEPRTVIPQDWLTSSVTWSADSQEVFFIRAFGHAGAGSDTAMYRVRVDGGEPQHMPFAGDNPWFLDASRQGKRLAYTRLQRDINIYEAEIGADGMVGPRRLMAASSRREESADPAPDGKLVTFASNRGGPMEIWISDRQGRGLTQLTSSAESQTTETSGPRWSPDGSAIAYQAIVKGSFEIFVVSPAGGPPLQLTGDAAVDQLPAWSSDSRWIYFASSRGGSTGIWKLPAAGGEAVPVVRDSWSEKTESPDGRWLYLRRGPKLFRVPTGGGEEEQIVSDLRESQGARGLVDWMHAAVTSKGIYYVARAEEGKPGWPIHFVAHSGGQPKAVGLIAKRVREGLTASPDGRYLYWSQFDVDSADLWMVEGFQ